MDFVGSPLHERLRALRERVDEALLSAAALSGDELRTHITELIGLVHSLDTLRSELAGTTPELATARAEIQEAVELLGERARILAQGR
jgi:hypothetical protein